MPAAFFAAFKSASEPRKNSSSVSTESAAAPAASKLAASVAGAVVLAQHAARRRRLLQFRDHVVSIARKRGRKISRRLVLFDRHLQRHVRQARVSGARWTRAALRQSGPGSSSRVNWFP